MVEVRPYNTSKQCHACQSKDTERYGGFKTWHNNNIIYENWSHDRKFRCRNCGDLTALCRIIRFLAFWPGPFVVDLGLMVLYSKMHAK